MTSRFYQRYVPPVKVHDAGGKANVNSHILPPVPVNGHNETSGVPPKIKKKSKKRRATEIDPEHRPQKRKSPEPEVQEPTPPKESLEEVIQRPEDHDLTPFDQPAQPTDDPEIDISSALPEWIRDPIRACNATRKPFKDFPLSYKVKSNLSKAGFSTANGLQTTVLPMILPTRERCHGDICISAATGSGKTLAYALPLIESLCDKPMARLRALIVVPTRELVSQAQQTLETMASGTGLKIGVAVGSNRMRDEQESLVRKFQKWRSATYNSRADDEFSRESRKIEVDDELSPELKEEKVDELRRKKRIDELMNWDRDFTDSKDILECQQGYIIDHASNIDILVCTPGRLVDHINTTKGFHLHHVEWLIIDEADKLLDESFQEWIQNVMPQLEYVPPKSALEDQMFQSFGLSQSRQVRKIILSATMTQDLSQLSSLRLVRPRMVVLESVIEPQRVQEGGSRQDESIKLPDSLVEIAMAVTEASYKPLYVIQLLQEFATLESGKARQDRSVTIKTDGDVEMMDVTEDSDGNMSDASSSASSTSSSSASTTSSIASPALSPQQPHQIPPTLIFARTNESALRLSRLLSLLLPHHQIRALTKSPDNRKGRKTLFLFQKGHVSVVVATDLASRGLDIPELGYVINYDMPASLVSYVHRVGRTARAGREGRAVTLVEHKEGNWFWSEVARARGVGRARKVGRMDGGLRAEGGGRRRYEDALEVLGREALGDGRGG